MTVLLVMLGGAAGAVLRYAADRALPAGWLPWGTLAANVAGSFTLGLLAGVTGGLAALLGTGLCGALTTYSTFGHQTVELAEQRQPGRALAYVSVSLSAGLAAVWLGRALVA